MMCSYEEIRRLVDALPRGYKTKDLDAIIARLVREKADVSALRPYILKEQDLHRIYYYVNLKQMKSAEQRMAFIDANLLFSDWWHTDQLIHFAAAMDFDRALSLAKGYMCSDDPFIRRWGYVLFISRLGRGHADALLPLLKDDDEYYVQMAEAWLIAELALDEPQAVYDWFCTNDLAYNINGKAIRKICDSFRIPEEWKEKYKELRGMLRGKEA